MTGLLDPELDARLSEQRERAVRARAVRQDSERSHGRSLLSAALDLEREIMDTSTRIMFGFPVLDDLIRGVRPKELCYLTGRAHSGKTQLLLHALWRWPTHRIVYFALDETPAHILRKLVAITHGIDSAVLDGRIKDGDRQAVELLRRTAEDEYPNLEIVDEALTATQMSAVVDEHEQRWGQACQGVFIDYLDLLPGGSDYHATKSKSVRLKAWARERNTPVVCIHQPRRGGVGRGERIGMDDMANAGETEAMFVLGVYRKRDDQRRDEDERAMHQDTLSVNLDKNKRTNVPLSVDLFLDPGTGRIRNLRPEDYAATGLPMTAADARAAVMSQHPSLPTGVIDLATRRGE